jgi:hypothetical protein
VRAIVETAGFALHDEEPERISCFFDETIVGSSFGNAASAASSRRPACPSADALSWAISYSRVAHPERSEFNAMGALRNIGLSAIP